MYVSVHPRWREGLVRGGGKKGYGFILPVVIKHAFSSSPLVSSSPQHLVSSNSVRSDKQKKGGGRASSPSPSPSSSSPSPSSSSPSSSSSYLQPDLGAIRCERTLKRNEANEPWCDPMRVNLEAKRCERTLMRSDAKRTLLRAILIYLCI